MYGKTLADYPEKLEAFKLALQDLKPEAIDYAFQQAIKTLTEFPTPAQIIAFGDNHVPRPELRLLEAPTGKPPGWRPLTDEDRAMLRENIERTANLKAMDRPARKSLHEQQRAMALQRLGGSTMPTDPAARKEWAFQMATKNGWKQRQPGEDDDE